MTTASKVLKASFCGSKKVRAIRFFYIGGCFFHFGRVESARLRWRSLLVNPVLQSDNRKYLPLKPSFGMGDFLPDVTRLAGWKEKIFAIETCDPEWGCHVDGLRSVPCGMT